jgi:hypothetical protein
MPLVGYAFLRAVLRALCCVTSSRLFYRITKNSGIKWFLVLGKISASGEILVSSRKAHGISVQRSDPPNGVSDYPTPLVELIENQEGYRRVSRIERANRLLDI